MADEVFSFSTAHSPRARRDVTAVSTNHRSHGNFDLFLNDKAQLPIRRRASIHLYT